MIFWILLGLLVLITAFVIYNESDSYGEPCLAGFVTLLIGSFVAAMIWGVCCRLIPKERVVAREDTAQLRVLGNDSAIEGRSYFLGGGYVKDKRVLNYITQSDSGAIKVQQADASASTIYEGSDNATVTVSAVDAVNGWVSPWIIDTNYAYEFHIPTGSVVESYTLDNK